MAQAQPQPLHFRACAGFANRMQALTSALCAAEDLGAPLQLWWPNEPGIFSCPFTSLFEKPVASNFTVQEGWPPAPFELICRDQEEWDRIANHRNRYPEKPCWVKSYSKFYTRDPRRWLVTLRGSFQPLEKHLAAVRKALTKGGGIGPLIGIHIRRTDNKICIEHSPTEKFIEKMKSQIQSHPDTTFFVASDDDSERQTMIDLFGEERIITLAKTLDRFTEQGGIDAFLDFLALSQCQEIWGSVYSSFSRLAAEYGGCPLTLIGTPYSK